MRNHLLFLSLLFILVIFTSCRPEGVVSREKMTDILFDVHIAEVVANPGLEPVPKEWRKGLREEHFRDLSYHSVLRKYHISEENFYKSVNYYSKNLRVYTKIYANINKRLNLYLQDVNDWKYHTPGADELYKSDSLYLLKISSLFSEHNYRPDTTKTKSYKILTDSVVTWAEWKTKEWLTEGKTKSVKFYIVDPKDYVDMSVFEIAKAKKDSIAKINEPAPVKEQVVNTNKDGTVVVSF